MDEQYYWIEIKFPFFGFWGTVFKFWAETKRRIEKTLNDRRICIINPINKNRIRDST